MLPNRQQKLISELITRLEDAHKGYLELYNASSNPIFRKWLKIYRQERYQYIKELHSYIKDIQSTPDLTGSLLGEIHRVVIDIKLNHIDESPEAVINEILRGSNFLIEDYKKVLEEPELSYPLRSDLTRQLKRIQEEVKTLDELKLELQENYAA